MEPLSSARALTHLSSNGRHAFEVWLSGEIDLLARDELDDVVEQVQRCGAPDIVVHLRDVTFFSSTGISLLVRLRAISVERGGNFSVRDAPPIVHRMLVVSSLEHLLADH